jgi:sphingomyelin phosphodiesterase
VYVTGHIAPGSTDCREEWSERVAAILARYENTVAGQMFGHTHHDSFSVATAAEGRRATGVQYVSPSVTTQTNINPSWRYYVVDVATHQIVDTETWHVDLTAAYASGRMTASLLYSARNAYGMTSLFPEDWKALAGRIASDNATFELYSNFFHTGNKAATCHAQCRESEQCTLVSATSALYHACTKQPQESHC